VYTKEDERIFSVAGDGFAGATNEITIMMRGMVSHMPKDVRSIVISRAIVPRYPACLEDATIVNLWHHCIFDFQNQSGTLQRGGDGSYTLLSNSGPSNLVSILTD